MLYHRNGLFLCVFSLRTQHLKRAGSRKLVQFLCTNTCAYRVIILYHSHHASTRRLPRSHQFYRNQYLQNRNKTRNHNYNILLYQLHQTPGLPSFTPRKIRNVVARVPVEDRLVAQQTQTRRPPLKLAPLLK